MSNQAATLTAGHTGRVGVSASGRLRAAHSAQLDAAGDGSVLAVGASGAGDGAGRAAVLPIAEPAGPETWTPGGAVWLTRRPAQYRPAAYFVTKGRRGVPPRRAS